MLRAPVWDYFAKEKAHGVWKAQFIWCMKYISGEIKAVPGTAHLMEHLDNCIGVSSDGGKKQTSLSIGSGKQMKISMESGVSDQQVAHMAFSSVFILQKYPLSTADHPGLHTFVRVYIMINQSTTREDILDIYEAGRKKVFKNLQNNKSRVAVATKFWTDNKKRRYMAVTAHFIDESWKRRRAILR